MVYFPTPFGDLVGRSLHYFYTSMFYTTLPCWHFHDSMFYTQSAKSPSLNLGLERPRPSCAHETDIHFCHFEGEKKVPQPGRSQDLGPTKHGRQRFDVLCLFHTEWKGSGPGNRRVPGPSLKLTRGATRLFDRSFETAAGGSFADPLKLCEEKTQKHPNQIVEAKPGHDM